MSATRQDGSGVVAVERAAPLDLERLVDLAVDVFLRQGYDGTSMADIAAAAAVRKASLYHHVAGKEELLRLGTQRSLVAYRAMLEEPGATLSGDPASRLRYVVRRTCELVVEYVPETALLIRARGNTETERQVLAERRELNEVFAGMIAEARGGGRADPDRGSRVRARLIFGMITSSVDWLGRSSSTLEDLIAEVESIIEGDWAA